MLGEGSSIDVVYLDCRKAFDTVPHKRLIDKVETAGIGGDVKNWIGNFLEDREQRVVIKNIQHGRGSSVVCLKAVS